MRRDDTVRAPRACIAIAERDARLRDRAMQMAERYAHVAVASRPEDILAIGAEWDSVVLLMGWNDGSGGSTEALVRTLRQARMALPIVVIADAVRGRPLTEALRQRLALAGADDCVDFSAAHADSAFGSAVVSRLRAAVPESVLRLVGLPILPEASAGHRQAICGHVVATWIARNARRRLAVGAITRWFGVSERCLLDWLGALGLATTRDVCALFRLLHLAIEVRDRPAAAAVLARNTGFGDEAALMHFLGRHTGCTLRELRAMSVSEFVCGMLRPRLVRNSSRACG